MDSKGIKTKKQARIDEKKGKITDVGDDNQHDEEAETNCQSSDEIVEESDLDESAMITETPGTETIEEPTNDESIIVEREYGRTVMTILFNPLRLTERQAFCDKWDYELGKFSYRFLNVRILGGSIEYPENFEFLSSEYGPGRQQSINPDGNCGFSAISFALTGTQGNSAVIRRDIIEYIEDALFRYTRLNQPEQWLCRKLSNICYIFL